MTPHIRGWRIIPTEVWEGRYFVSCVFLGRHLANFTFSGSWGGLGVVSIVRLGG
jgi:hypothetical protein